MIKMKIVKWNDDNSWTDWSGHAKSQLISQLREYGGLPLTKTKHLVRHVLERTCFEIQLPKVEGADGIRHMLESLGAEVLLVKIDNIDNIQPDNALQSSLPPGER